MNIGLDHFIARSAATIADRGREGVSLAE